MGRDQGNQGRSGNLSESDRSRGGQTSANEQNRDDQGQFTGTGMNQRRLGSAAVQRKVSSDSRVTVPSSITLPCSSHHGV